MKRWGIGVLAVGFALVAASGEGMAQERPSVSQSESSRSGGATCVVAGEATDCAGTSIAGPVGPTIVAAPMMTGPMAVRVTTGRVVGPVGNGSFDADTDVDRSTLSGSAVER